MTATVWKYRLELGDYFSLDLPEGALPLRVGMQDGALHLWALVDPYRPVTRRTFRIAGTGHPVRATDPYIGTVHDRVFVWHVFEALEPANA